MHRCSQVIFAYLAMLWSPAFAGSQLMTLLDTDRDGTVDV
jgi:hypothetical protein